MYRKIKRLPFVTTRRKTHKKITVGKNVLQFRYHKQIEDKLHSTNDWVPGWSPAGQPPENKKILVKKNTKITVKLGKRVLLILIHHP